MNTIRRSSKVLAAFVLALAMGLSLPACAAEA